MKKGSYLLFTETINQINELIVRNDLPIQQLAFNENPTWIRRKDNSIIGCIIDYNLNAIHCLNIGLEIAIINKKN